MNIRKNLIKILLGAVVLLSAASVGNAQSSRFIDALKYYQQNDNQNAVQLLKEEIAANPNNDAAYYYIALTLTDDPNSINECEYYFKKALEKDPNNYWYKYSLAIFYARTERIELTTLLLEELMAEYPKKSDLYFTVVNAYLSQSDIEKALATLDKIETINGKNELIGLTKFDLLLQKDPQNEKGAFAFLEEFYQDCKTPRIATNLADYYSRSYNDSTALYFYNQAIELNPDYTPAYYGKAHVYQALRQYDKYFENIAQFIKDPNIKAEAKVEYFGNMMQAPQFVRAFSEEIDTLVFDMHDIHPKDSAATSFVGLYYYQTGREDQAVETFRKNVELFPESKGIASDYTLVLYYTQRWEELIHAATNILTKEPSNTNFLQLRAIASMQLEQYEEAITDYLQMLKIAPKDSAVVVSSNSALGDLYHITNQSKKAYQHYEKVLKRVPNYAPVLNNYAYYLSEEGKKLKKAREMSQKTVQQEPDNPTYLDTYAWILHLLGQDVEAKALFKHAMLYGGKESAVILDHYAEVLFALKEYDLAFIYWNQAKGLDATLGIDEKIKQRKGEIGR